MPGKSYNEQPKAVYDYLKALEEKKSELIQQWPDNFIIDKQMREKYGFDQFSRKMRNLIDQAYKQVLKLIGAR